MDALVQVDKGAGAIRCRSQRQCQVWAVLTV
jgi:hypothetical protein